MILQRTVDTYAGMYDFAVSGGAVGTIDLQVPIPTNSIITHFCTTVSSTVTSAGASLISFDIIITNASPVVVSVGTLAIAQTFANWAVTADVVNGIYPGNAANPVFNAGIFSLSIGMSISVDPLTAGKIKFFATCVSFDLF